MPSPVIPQISSISPRIPFDPYMKRINELNSRITSLILLVSASSINIFAQGPSVKGKQIPEASGEVWFYITVSVVLVSLGVVFYFWRKSRKSIEQLSPAPESPRQAQRSPFGKHRGTGFAGPPLLPPARAEARGSKPACAGLDGPKSRCLWQRLVPAERHEVRERGGEPIIHSAAPRPD